MRVALIIIALAAYTSVKAVAHEENVHQSSERPNIVFILVDDLGWKDVGFMGSSFYETPNLDRLAREGMIFTNAYAAAPICSPTRASILSGEYPARLHLTDWLPGRGNKPDQQLLQVEDRDFLPLEATTIAEVLGRAGYRTFFAGKWHLGGEEHLPTDQGFDVNVGGYAAGSPGRFEGYFSPYGNPYLEDGPDGEYLTDRLTSETIAFIEAHQKIHQGEPFLAYLAYYTVHIPLQAKERLVEKYERKARQLPPVGAHGPTFTPVSDPSLSEEEGYRLRMVQSHPVYAAMIESLDRNVGQLMDALERLGLAKSTIVILTSDNGGLSTAEGSPTSNLPLRAGKGWLYEGGIRVPLIVRWPGVTEPGSRSSEPATSTDFFPTILEMAGVEKTYEVIDGVSLVPVLTGRGGLEREALYWHYPHYSNQGGRPGGAIRAGEWKLIEFYEDGTLELYHLAKDIAEQENLAEERPEKAAALQQRLEAWHGAVDAQMPKPNPHYVGRRK